MVSKKLSIEVGYALPDKQVIEAVEVDAGTTIEKAIRQSGILKQFPKINLRVQKVGVFSKPRQLSDVVQEGDRIEIYRSLIINPKEARRIKAKKAARRK